MRLLSVEDLSLHEFNESDKIPAYAILSHTWGKDEVSLDDIKNDTSRHKTAYAKIQNSCRLASNDGLRFVWIDTCCINKSSSAELSEAINSMFKWYENAKICYAYLEDVPHHQGAFESAIRKSRWFTRGWTLQELLAPSNLVFLSHTWLPIGTRQTLSRPISHLTSIDPDILHLKRSLDPNSHNSVQSLLGSKSLAKRMSWAAHRQTTRPEDQAYCLLGLFNVHMPLLYGEGLSNAFFRLQAEILRQSTDQTLLVWSQTGSRSKHGVGWLAGQPKDFAHSGSMAEVAGSESTFEMTNRGLKIPMRLIKEGVFSHTVWGVLVCHEEDDFSSLLAIPLTLDPGQKNDRGRIREVNGYLRLANLPPKKISQEAARAARWETVYLLTKPSSFTSLVSPQHFILKDSQSLTWLPMAALPRERWNAGTRTMQFRHTNVEERCGALALKVDFAGVTVSVAVIFGLDLKNHHHGYIRLYFGGIRDKFPIEPSENWLRSLLADAKATKSTERFMLPFTNGVSLMALIKEEMVFGKPVFTINIEKIENAPSLVMKGFVQNA